MPTWDFPLWRTSRLRCCLAAARVKGAPSCVWVGTCTQAHQGSKKGDITQRADVGYCPCCTRPAHVAAPSRYVTGGFFAGETHGDRVWGDHRPSAPRYLAATLYARVNGRFSTVWDWTAQYLILKAPALFVGFFGTGHMGAPVSPAPSAREHLGAPPKPPSPSPDASPSIQEDPSNRRRHPPTQLGSQGYPSVPAPPPTQPSQSEPRGGHRELTPKKAPRATGGQAADLDVPTSRTSRTTPSEEDSRKRASRIRSEKRHPSSSPGQSRASSKTAPYRRKDWKSDWVEK